MPAFQSSCQYSSLRTGALLALVIVLLASVAGAQLPPEDPGVKERLTQAIGEQRWDDALAHADTAAYSAHTAYMEILQEIVRLHCRKGDKEEAYQALDDMLEARYWNFRLLRQDPEIALISGEDRFKAAIRGAWSKQYIQMLERDSRGEMQLPDRIMQSLDFQPGERVADVGAGSGYFTIPIAREVAGGGKVLALDIRQEMLDYIADRVEDEGLENVELGLVAADDPQLPEGGIDTIFMVDVFHYIKERTAYGEKLLKGLAPGGRLVVIDFRYDPDAVREFAPPIQQQVAREALDADMAAAGFRVRESYDFLPEQYFVVYEAR